jgi:threonine/homoserine/homoserine lactone efflux protein
VPVIPLFLYPALKGAWQQAWIAAAVFGGVTILTMVTLIYAGAASLNFAVFRKIERYGHAVAGLLIFLCGVSVKFLGM